MTVLFENDMTLLEKLTNNKGTVSIALGKELAKEVFPILIDSTNNVIINEHNWIMEAFIKIGKYLTRKEKNLVLDFCEEFKNHPKKATQVRISKLKKICK